MEKIKMVDLQSQYLKIRPEIDRAIEKVLLSTAFIDGPDVLEFSANLGRHIGSAYTVTCANGTDALQIAMMALELKRGDEVILPVHTYVATAEVIALLGLTPVFVDVDENTFNLDVNSVKNKITGRTKAIVPVHLYGQCADIEPLLTIARNHNLHIIEDAAQALGAVYTFSNSDRRYAGTMGTIGTTSFFPSKNLGCFGDGGAIFTNSASLAERIKMTANHGQKTKYHHELVGVNSRLDTLQAAILNVKLRHLDLYTQQRNRVASFYDSNLRSLDFLDIPFRAPYSTHVFHQYTVKIKDGKRDKFKRYLEENSIPSMIYYPLPLHLQNAYRTPSSGAGSFPVAESLSDSVISLPIHTEMKDDQLEYIIHIIRRF